MFKQFCEICLPYIVSAGISLALFILAYILYHILIFSMKKMAKAPIGSHVVRGIRRPILALFMETAAFFSLYLFAFKDSFHHLFSLIILVLVVITAGWLLIRMTRLYFKYLIEGYKSDPQKKSSVIQIQFVYRLLVIAVAVLTIGGLLLLFPSAKNLGIGLLGSAGVVGIVIGMAARPIFLNLMAGLQIALTKTINLDDAVIIDGDFGRIESIHLTYVVVRTWDLKRNVIPISQFIDKPFQNLDLRSSEKLGSVFLYVDYRMSVDHLRKKFAEVVESCPQYNGTVYKLHVVDMTPSAMQIRLVMTAADATSTFELRCFVREKLIEFLQKEHSDFLPCVREIQKTV